MPDRLDEIFKPESPSSSNATLPSQKPSQGNDRLDDIFGSKPPQVRPQSQPELSTSEPRPVSVSQPSDKSDRWTLPPAKKSQKTLPDNKPGFFKQAWEGTKEVGKGFARGVTQAQGMVYSALEAPLTEMEQYGKTLPKATGHDYDMEGYIKKYGQPDQSKGQHLTDEFKNPGHITFSKESKYSKPGQEGGEWKYLDGNGRPMEEKAPGGQWHFYASPYNISQHSAQELQA